LHQPDPQGRVQATRLYFHLPHNLQNYILGARHPVCVPAEYCNMAVAFSIAMAECPKSLVPYRLAGDMIKARFFTDAILIERSLTSFPKILRKNPNCRTSPCESAPYRRGKKSQLIGTPIAF
jgi:hypothetical protein